MRTQGNNKRRTKEARAKEWWIRDTQGKLKRTKRDRETKDREWVSVSEIRPLLSTVQRSKAECEFEISWEENIKLWQHLSHAHGPEEIKSYTQQSHAVQARLSLPSLSTFSHFRLQTKVTKRYFVIAHPQWCHQREVLTHFVIEWALFRCDGSRFPRWWQFNFHQVVTALLPLACAFEMNRHFQRAERQIQNINQSLKLSHLECAVDVSHTHTLPQYLLMS